MSTERDKEEAAIEMARELTGWKKWAFVTLVSAFPKTAGVAGYKRPSLGRFLTEQSGDLSGQDPAVDNDTGGIIED